MVKSKYLFSLLFFLVYSCSFFFTNNMVVASTSSFFHVGVVLDLTSTKGEISESCISMALSDFYEIHANYKTRVVLHTMDSENNVVVSASSALYLMKDVKVQAIIGPQESTQASFVTELGEKAQVPIVSFSATSPSLSPLKNPYFVRTAVDDSIQVKAIVDIIQAFEWKEVVLIYEDTDYGNGVLPYFFDAFQEIAVRVPYKSNIPLDANDDHILEELHKLKAMPTRVFIVHMSSSVGSRLFLNANNAGMMSQGYVWIVTDGLSSLMSPMSSSAIESMEGVLGVRPYIPKSKKLEEFKVKWRRSFNSNKTFGEISEPSLYGIWAYDTTWALAMAVEQVGSLNPQFLSSNTTNNLTDLSSLGYSSIGPHLLQTILSTRFKGLSGDFHLVKGQLESFAFQIFNVVGEGERVIGYWTQMGGISRQLNTTTLKNSSSMSSLKTIVWPGDSTAKPKGWAIPPYGKEELTVLVPAKTGFNQFVSMERDPSLTNKAFNITGFCIEVFRNITSILPFGLPYKFQPYPLDGEYLQSYDELIDQVYLKNFGAAVGDISILENRSKYVDFTLPYTESGVTMVVAVKDDVDKELFSFLQPLSLDLWVVTLLGFTCVGVVVWILEHRRNPELGSSPGQQLQTSIWFSFLTLVFAQREKIEGISTRVVLFAWMFFVLILTQSYTANLSSILTTQQLQPTIKDVNVIKSNGYHVGYQDGSFVEGFLLNHLNFDKSKLKSYGSPEEYHNALSLGSDNGGVAAIFDEIPYVQVFLNMYCNQYTTVGRVYSSEGFGFVFPKGSPLIPYMSMAILNLTDNGKLDKIKQGWLQNKTNCNSFLSTSTNQLTVKSFGGLLSIILGFIIISLVTHGLQVAYGTNWLQVLWRKITYSIEVLKGMPHVTETESMELGPRGAEHRDVAIVEVDKGVTSNQDSQVINSGRYMQNSRSLRRARTLDVQHNNQRNNPLYMSI